MIIIIMASLIISGDWEYAKVPPSIKTQVDERLVQFGCAHLIEGAE